MSTNESPSELSSRRGFIELAAGASVALAAAQKGAAQTAPNPVLRPVGVNPFKDPGYAAGAKMRAQEFIGRGADPKEVARIFETLTTLDAEPWVAEWTKLAEPFEHQAADLEKKGQLADANKLYLKAAAHYGIAKFPVINHPAKKAAYKKAIENYLKGARTLDPPVERIAIPFEGKEIIGYLRKPKDVTRPPIVIATGGVDVYKEERNTIDILSIGAAAFSMDMPGAGECPVFNTPDAEKLYIATIEYLLGRDDLDGKRMGFRGNSYAGYWGGKMAYVEAKRLKASIMAGGPIHYTFQEPWLKGLITEKDYFWPFLESMIYSNGVKDYAELVKTAPAMSLDAQGLLDKPCAPMFAYNGAKDPWISPQEIPLLIETGDPKTVRIIADGAHMGRGSKQGPRVARGLSEWFKARLFA
jgi:esterase FrsA